MNGPSVTTGLPLLNLTVVAVRSGCSSCPPVILVEYLPNHSLIGPLAACRWASGMASHCLARSLLSVNSSTYFICELLLDVSSGDSRFVQYDERGDRQIDSRLISLPRLRGGSGWGPC